MMRKLIIVLAIMAFAFGVASARQSLYEPRQVREVGRSDWFWVDALEPEDPGWEHGDYTATAVPHFHLDTYMAYGGSGYSYWCGNFDYDADGGYGNGWDDRLDSRPLRGPGSSIRSSRSRTGTTRSPRTTTRTFRPIPSAPGST
jgi:hypothetical protein